MKKYKTVQELNGIKVGLATAFNDDKIEQTEVLRIFPNGNNATFSNAPYYVRTSIGALSYFKREHFKESRCDWMLNLFEFAAKQHKRNE